MDIGEYGTTLRRRWRVIVAAVVATCLAGLLITWTTPPSYSASAQSFVTIGMSDDGSTSSIYQESQFTLQRVKSYTQLISSPAVLQSVADDLGLGLSVARLREMVSAKSPLNTVLIEVTAVDGSASQAAAIADAASRELGDTIETLERPQGGRSPVVVTLVQPATVPVVPSSPRPALNLALALVLGLALGLAAAVVREKLDSTVRSKDELRAVVDAPPLGAVPFDRGLQTRHLLAVDPDSASSEHFRTIRTNLQFVDVDKPVRHFVVTSAVAEEGKTTAACNLAVSIAQSGQRVCLVEADLRRPKAAHYFGVEGAVGLTDVVTGGCSLDEALLTWDRKGSVSILAAGRRPPDANSVLGSAAVARLMAELVERFDVVIYDAPPLGPVTDAALLARRTDGAVLVVRHAHARRAHIRDADQSLRLAGTRVLGTVLTFVPRKAARDAYSYAYPSSDETEPVRLPSPGPVARSSGADGYSLGHEQLVSDADFDALVYSATSPPRAGDDQSRR